MDNLPVVFDQAAHMAAARAKGLDVLRRNRAKNTPTKLRLFCIAIATHGNGAQAVRDAGYSNKYPGQWANKLLKHPKVAAYIAELREKLESDKIATLQEVRELWTHYIRGAVPYVRVDDDGKAVQGFLTPDASDRLRAAEALAKSLGGMIDKTVSEHTERHEEVRKIVIERRIVHVNADAE